MSSIFFCLTLLINESIMSSKSDDVSKIFITRAVFFFLMPESLCKVNDFYKSQSRVLSRPNRKTSNFQKLYLNKFDSKSR